MRDTVTKGLRGIAPDRCRGGGTPSALIEGADAETRPVADIVLQDRQPRVEPCASNAAQGRTWRDPATGGSTRKKRAAKKAAFQAARGV